MGSRRSGEGVEQRGHVQHRGLGLFRKSGKDHLYVIGNVAGGFLRHRLRVRYSLMLVVDTGRGTRSLSRLRRQGRWNAVRLLAALHQSHVGKGAEKQPGQQAHVAHALGEFLGSADMFK